MKELISLKVDNNKLTELPRSVVHLANLSYFKINKNDLTYKHLAGFLDSNVKNYAIAQIYLEIVYCRVGKNKFKPALDILKKINIIVPDNAFVWNYQGTILYSELKKTDEAEKAYKKATKIKPDYAVALFNLGHLYNSKGEYKRAVSYLKKAVKNRPSFISAHISLGFAYSKSGQTTKAENSAKKVLEIDPDDKFALINLGFYSMQLQKYKQSEKYLLQGMRLYPKEGNFCYNLAMLYAHTEDISLCLEYLKKAIKRKASFLADIRTQTEFDIIRKNKEFKNLVQIYKKSK